MMIIESARDIHAIKVRAGMIWSTSVNTTAELCNSGLAKTTDGAADSRGGSSAETQTIKLHNTGKGEQSVLFRYQ